MLLLKVIGCASVLIAMFDAIPAIPQPGIIRERHIIHAPIKFKIIHHYNVKKVPIIIKKHLHYYKPQEDIHHHPNTIPEENHANQIYEEDTDGHYNQFKSHQQVYLPKFKIFGTSFQQDDYDNPEEDYEEQEQPEQSQEEEYKDYEYE